MTTSNRENANDYYFHPPKAPTLSHRRTPKPHPPSPRSKSLTQSNPQNSLPKNPKTLLYNGALKIGQDFYKVLIQEIPDEECVEIMFTNHKNMKLEISKKFDVQIWSDI